MRFWQKTYVLTLILFLLCMNAAIFSLAYYTYHRSVESNADGCRSERFYIEKSFERDYDDMNSAGAGADPVLLMQSYCTYYEKQGILLDFLSDGISVCSSYYESNGTVSAKDSVTYEKYGGEKYIFITADICNGKYTLVYGKNVAELDEEFRSLMITYCITSLGVSVLLAVCLFFVLKQLSTPLERLRKTTETISGGDYSVTADESGNDEFSELARSFNVMVGCVNDKMEELRLNAEQNQRLVDNMAHEMRTPLTSIYGYAEYLRRTNTTEEEKIDSAICIMSESERLCKISEKLLDTAYIRNNEIKKEPVDIAALLCDTAGKLLPNAEKAGVELVCVNEPLTVDGDEVLLSMLFYNLTENALKACNEKGKVTLSCRNGENGPTVTVKDNGKGMTAEQLSHVTEPFYRTDRSRSRAEGGAGLGLALCRQIAESHGAVMLFESESGKGTSVTVTFTH